MSNPELYHVKSVGDIEEYTENPDTNNPYLQRFGSKKKSHFSIVR